jgi:negative regulator of replication initiation
MITIKMEERLAAYLEYLARTENRSVSDVVRRMIKNSAMTETIRQAEISEELVDSADIAEWDDWASHLTGEDRA